MEMRDLLKEYILLTKFDEAYKIMVKKYETMFVDVLESYEKITNDKSLRENYKSIFNELNNIDQIINILSPIYEKYYTVEIMKNVVEFYRGNFGQKYAQHINEVFDDSYLALEKWSRGIINRATKELYNLDQTLN